MQLDPQIPFSSQIQNISGQDFENIVTASFFLNGYITFRNLKIMINRQEIAEIDTLASFITPLKELRIAVECKGGRNISFEEIRKFSTVKHILDTNLDLMMYGGSVSQEDKDLATRLGVNLHSKNELNMLVLPIIQGGNDIRENRIKNLNKILTIFALQDYLIKIINRIPNQLVKDKIKPYQLYLQRELWIEENPIKQLENSFEKYNATETLTQDVADLLGIDLDNELRNPTSQNISIQSTMLLQLLHRIFNLYAVIRTCIYIKQTDRNLLIQIQTRHSNLANVINNLSDIIEDDNINKLLNFFCRWVFLWGGFIVKSQQDLEYELLAKESNISVETVKIFMDIIKTVYSGNHGSLILNTTKFSTFKWIPSAFRGLGLYYRRQLQPDIYNQINVFSSTEDAHYLRFLETCLSNTTIQNTNGLKIV